MTFVERTHLQIGQGSDTVIFKYEPDSDYILIGMGKEEAKVKYIDLWGVIFSMGDERQKEQLIPVRQTEMLKYERIHSVQLKKDMKRGQIMNVKCVVDIPKVVATDIENEIMKAKMKKNIKM